MGQNTSNSSSSLRKSSSRSMLSKKVSSSKLLKGLGNGDSNSGSNVLNLPQQRVIMLGTGGVGKSTLFKNIKLLFNGGFDNDEYLSYREVILSNIVQMVQFVLRALSSMFPDEKLKKIENEEFANSVLRLDCEDFIHILRIVDEQFITRMQKLWFEEPIIQKAYHFRHRYQLPVEDLPDLVKQMDQIYSMPKTKHVMSSYVKTTGIVETECIYRNNRIRVFDTGGQRNERKKWVHLFGSTSGIVFIVSLSEYNQVCYEDDRSNRMKESLLLFEEIVNASCFEDVPIFLVFNKKDVFLHKIQYFDISEAFDDLPKHIRLHKPIKNFHKLAGDAKRRHTIQQKRKRIPGTFESAQNSKTMERFQRARSASIQKQKKSALNVGSFIPKMSPSRFVVENHHMLTEEEEFKIRQENWQKLPSDILIYICFFLDAHDLCVLSSVNYEMYIVATCDTVWRSLCYSLMKDIDEEQVDLLYKERYHLFEPGITGKGDDASPLFSSKSLLPSLNSCTSISSITTDRSPMSSKTISIGSNIFNSSSSNSTISTREKPISITVGDPLNTSAIFSDSSSDDDPTNQSFLQSTYSFCSSEEREFKKRKWRFFYEIGGYVYRDSMKFVQQQFIDLAKDEERKSQLWRDVRVTSATNGSAVRDLLEYVFDTIIDGQEMLSPTKETTFEFDEELNQSSPSSTKAKSPRLLKKLINLK